MQSEVADAHDTRGPLGTDVAPAWRFVAAGATSIQRGWIEAESATQVREQLRAKGLELLELTPVRSEAWFRSPAAKLRGFWHAALRQRRGARLCDALDGLATLLRSGGSLPESLSALASERRREDRALHTFFEDASNEVRAGSTLAHAWRAQHGWLDGVDLALLAAGERSGDLARVLERIVARRERATLAQSRVVGALAYPSIVAVLAFAVVLFLGSKTLPDLERLLVGAGLETPWLTASVIDFSKLLLVHGFWLAPLVLLVGAGVVCSIHAWRERGCALPGWLERLQPRVGRELALARVARGLAELLGAGLPWIDALAALQPTARNRDLVRGLTRAQTLVRDGKSPAEALGATPVFGHELARLVTLGERSGRMEDLLTQAADRMERRAARALDRLVLWLEPATILLLASVIGALALAAVLPLVRLQEVLR